MEAFNKRRKMWDERFWLFVQKNSLLSNIFIRHPDSSYYLLHESIKFQLFTFPALYITLTNTLTHKDKDRETESEKEQNAPKRPRCCLLGFLLIAVVVRER